jgi:tetratricopeptide (TPR) repeat protein
MRLFFAPEIETTVWGERAEREARAALNSEPNLAEAHEALAAVYRAVEFDWGGTIEESRRALELNPNLDQPHYYRASAFWHLGLFELAELEVRRGEEINPANRADPLRQRGIAALFTGRFHKAIPLLRDVQQITTGHASDYLLGQAYYYDGERTRGEEVLADLHGTTPADRRAQAVLASLLAARADTTQAEALLRTLTGGGFVDHHVMYSLGVAHLHLGDRTTALKWLRQAAETGLTYYPWYQQDPLLDPFRSDPGFRQFLEDMRSSWESAKEKYQRESR